MNERRVDTIDIGKGIKYAKVASRLQAFHEGNLQCEIRTECEFKEGFALFSATVTTKKGTFSGHSLAKVTAGNKQFEKQETIAVGRALAFAGYLSSGDVASQEEMEEYQSGPVTLDDLNQVKKAWAAKHRDELGDADATVQRQLFCKWVKRHLAVDGVEPAFNPLEYAEWSVLEMEACRDALGREP